MRKTSFAIVLFGAACVLPALIFSRPAARAETTSESTPDIIPGIEIRWGGHARVIGTVTAVDEDSLLGRVDDGPYIDGQAEWRQKNRLNIGSRWTFDTHYELVAAGGDTRETIQTLSDMLPGSPSAVVFADQPINDDRRLMDLTHVISDTDDHIIYHRLDRLNLTWTPDWGTLRIGRQALTWGDGLVFNPMDLFNPFAPAAVQRDYKVGDDMALVQIPIGEVEIQTLYLPRRDPLTGSVEDDNSSYAMKAHLFAGAMEASAMAARHFDDAIGALGASGYLKEAAWRVNAVYSHVTEESREDDFFQVVANLDYAWMWAGKNVYGLLEFYYNGVGRINDYGQAFESDALMDRILRGELFTLGRFYLAGQAQVELHPLVQWHTTAIFNLADPSGLLQPQILWDAGGDVQLIFGVQWHWGASGTEFGGFDVDADGLAFKATPNDQAYLWLTYYF